jgi:acetoin utilization deacetylase AcuC-like enzyme
MPAASLSSGFHHACWSYGGGYCTFNGLMITAASLLKSGRADRVAILDCDAHYGNGTDDILDHRRDLAPRILHQTMGESGSRGVAYLRKLRRFLEEIERFQPDIILYQAGADPHVNDPLGGVITTEEMTERDRMVFRFASRTRTPLTWNLAGGYQRGGVTGIDPVLALHLNTFAEACRAYGVPLPVGPYE